MWHHPRTSEIVTFFGVLLCQFMMTCKCRILVLQNKEQRVGVFHLLGKGLEEYYKYCRFRVFLVLVCVFFRKGKDKI